MKKSMSLVYFALLVLFSVPGTQAQSVVCSWEDSGSEPAGIISDNQGNEYATLYGTSQLVKLGSDGCTPTKFYDLPSVEPIDVAFDGTNLWVTLYSGNAIDKINASSGNGTVYTVGSNPRGVVFDGTYIWVANYGSNSVTKLLASNGYSYGSFPVGSGPYFMAYNSVNQTIWVANRNSASITVLNQNGVTVNTIATGSEPQFLTTLGGDVWVSCYSSQLVEQFSSSGALVASYAITGHSQPTGISLGTDDVLWGATVSGAVFFIPAGGGAVHYASPIGDTNYDTVYDPAHNLVWVTDYNQGKVVEVSPN